MAEPTNESPFAEFAEPERSAVDEWRQRQCQGRTTSPGLRRALAVVGVITLLGAVVALAVEHRFWLLTLTGRRATASISTRQEHVIGWAFTSLSAARGQAHPITETEFQFTFTDASGANRQDSFRVPGASDAFRIGDSIGVMYPRLGSGTAQPSSWGFYVEHDSAWLTLNLFGCGCLLVASACWWQIRRANLAARLA